MITELLLMNEDGPPTKILLYVCYYAATINCTLISLDQCKGARSFFLVGLSVCFLETVDS